MLLAHQYALFSHFGTPLTPLALCPRPFTNSHRIRTSARHTRNPFRMRTSKTLDLMLFRMNTYRKTGEGVPATPNNADSSLCTSLFLCEASANSAPEFTPIRSGRYLFLAGLAIRNIRNTHKHPQPFSAHGF